MIVCHGCGKENRTDGREADPLLDFREGSPLMKRRIALVGLAGLLVAIAMTVVVRGSTAANASSADPAKRGPGREADTSSLTTATRERDDSGQRAGAAESTAESPQVLYSVGGRPQRVRFMIAAHGQTFDQMQKILGPNGSASIRKMIEDPIQSMPNVPQGKYIRQAKPPAAPGVGLDSFAEGDNFYAGEVINPGLVMCSANLLDLAKAAGDQYPGLFQSRAINEINLFARAVPAPTGDDTLRVGIGPAAVGQPGSALNILVEFLPLQIKCSLPTLDELERRLAQLDVEQQ